MVKPESEPTPTLGQIVTESRHVLLHIETVFPITLFPSSVTVDLNQVSVVRRGLLRPKQVITSNLEDVSSVEADLGPFFAMLVINSRFLSSEPLSVNFLSKDDAILARRLINGLLVAHKNNINLEDEDPTKLRQKLIEIGKTHG